MAHSNHEELSGITLTVYLYIVKKGTPVGPRDAVKGAHLSSPSVAYRHLQKLEEMGLVQKNEYGEYIIKNKPTIPGYIWIGRHAVPKMFIYASIFATILIVELIVFAIHYHVEDEKFVTFFLLLMLVTGAATAILSIEGILQSKRIKQSTHIDN